MSPNTHTGRQVLPSILMPCLQNLEGIGTNAWAWNGSGAEQGWHEPRGKEQIAPCQTQSSHWYNIIQRWDNLCLLPPTNNVMEQPLVLSHLILSIMPLPSYQMNYPTFIWFQFGCYETALYLIFYILSLFGHVDIIIRFDSCLALLHTADSMPSHTAYTQTLSLFSQTIFLLSYSISLYVLFFHTLSSYLLISDSSDSRIISHWRISGPYLIGW